MYIFCLVCLGGFSMNHCTSFSKVLVDVFRSIHVCSSTSDLPFEVHSRGATEDRSCSARFLIRFFSSKTFGTFFANRIFPRRGTHPSPLPRDLLHLPSQTPPLSRSSPFAFRGFQTLPSWPSPRLSPRLSLEVSVPAERVYLYVGVSDEDRERLRGCGWDRDEGCGGSVGIALHEQR